MVTVSKWGTGLIFGLSESKMVGKTREHIEVISMWEYVRF